MSEMTDPRAGAAGLKRHLPLILIAAVALVGVFTLRDTLSFETLAENRDALIALRDDHFVLIAAAFVLIYVAIVAFSLPGAAVAELTTADALLCAAEVLPLILVASRGWDPPLAGSFML